MKISFKSEGFIIGALMGFYAVTPTIMPTDSRRLENMLPSKSNTFVGEFYGKNEMGGKKGYVISYDIEDELGVVDGKVDVKIPVLECNGSGDNSFGYYDSRKNIFYYTGITGMVNGKQDYHLYQKIENPKKNLFDYAPDCP